MNNRANLYHHLLIQVNMVRIPNAIKKFTMGLNIAKKKSEGEGTPTFNNGKRMRRSGEGAKQLFPKDCMIYKHSGAINVKYKRQFPRFLTLQTSADPIVRFANIKEDENMLKIVCYGKLLEREFIVHEKCYREYTRLPKNETVKCLKCHIKNANTKYFTTKICHQSL